MHAPAPWHSFVQTLEDCLRQVQGSGVAGTALNDTLAHWHQMTLDVRNNDNTLFLIGNGASASMASHFAADLVKNAHIRAHVFTDLSQLTAIANDMNFEEVYAVPLRRYARQGDMLVAISSSGASPNILAAVKAARAKGLRIATLSAFAADNPLRTLGDLNFYVPATTYGLAETSHSALLHHWMDALVLP